MIAGAAVDGVVEDDSVDQFITRNQLRVYKTRWHKLAENRARNEFEIAQFASEVRKHLPDGGPGDILFRRACTVHLDVSPQRAAALLRMAKAFAIGEGLDQQDTWANLGGWPSIFYLSSLRSTARRRVIAAMARRATEQGYAVSVHSLKLYADDNSLGTPVAKRGARRKSASEAELDKLRRHRNVLRKFVNGLYAAYEDLPRWPADVKVAMAGE